MNKKALIFGGGAIAVVAIVVALIFIFTGGEDTYRSIKVFEINGSCAVDRKGDSLDAFKNMTLSSGDTFTVGEGSFARLKLDDDKYVYLEANTKINLTATGTAKDSKTMVYIERGSMLTEVKKKLSATSSYDIVTPNTTMSIRGTKTLTQVLEDAVTGHVQTSNAVLEGQVKIKAVKVKADGTVVSVEKDLGAGEGNAFSSNKEELVSQEEMKSIADTGASVNGIKVEIVSEEDADVVFDVATFEASFLENVKNILVADAQAETGEEGLSQEQIDAINAQLDEVLESFDVISTESQNAINAAASGEIEPEPTPEITPEPTPEATSESLWSWENIAVTETEDTQDEGTTLIEGDTNLLVIDDTDEEDDTADRDNGADEVATEDDDNDDSADGTEEDGEEADETDEDEVSDEDDNAGEDDVDDADDVDEEDKSDEEGEEENTDEEDADKEDGEDEETEDEESEEEPKDESVDGETSEESEETPAEQTTQSTPSSGTGTGTSSESTSSTRVIYNDTTIPVSFRMTSGMPATTVSAKVKFSATGNSGTRVSISDLPSLNNGDPLPGTDLSDYKAVVVPADENAQNTDPHASAVESFYSFTGWYTSATDAEQNELSKRVTTYDSSVLSNGGKLYPGIAKATTIRIYNTDYNMGYVALPGETDNNIIRWEPIDGGVQAIVKAGSTIHLPAAQQTSEHAYVFLKQSHARLFCYCDTDYISHPDVAYSYLSGERPTETSNGAHIYYAESNPTITVGEDELYHELDMYYAATVEVRVADYHDSGKVILSAGSGEGELLSRFYTEAVSQTNNSAPVVELPEAQGDYTQKWKIEKTENAYTVNQTTLDLYKLTTVYTGDYDKQTCVVPNFYINGANSTDSYSMEFLCSRKVKDGGSETVFEVNTQTNISSFEPPIPTDDTQFNALTVIDGRYIFTVQPVDWVYIDMNPANAPSSAGSKIFTVGTNNPFVIPDTESQSSHKYKFAVNPIELFDRTGDPYGLTERSFEIAGGNKDKHIYAPDDVLYPFARLGSIREGITVTNPADVYNSVFSAEQKTYAYIGAEGYKLKGYRVLVPRGQTETAVFDYIFNATNNSISGGYGCFDYPMTLQQTNTTVANKLWLGVVGALYGEYWSNPRDPIMMMPLFTPVDPVTVELVYNEPANVNNLDRGPFESKYNGGKLQYYYLKLNGVDAYTFSDYVDLSGLKLDLYNAFPDYDGQGVPYPTSNGFSFDMRPIDSRIMIDSSNKLHVKNYGSDDSEVGSEYYVFDTTSRTLTIRLDRLYARPDDVSAHANVNWISCAGGYDYSAIYVRGLMGEQNSAPVSLQDYVPSLKVAPAAGQAYRYSIFMELVEGAVWVSRVFDATTAFVTRTGMSDYECMVKEISDYGIISGSDGYDDDNNYTYGMFVRPDWYTTIPVVHTDGSAVSEDELTALREGHLISPKTIKQNTILGTIGYEEYVGVFVYNKVEKIAFDNADAVYCFKAVQSGDTLVPQIEEQNDVPKTVSAISFGNWLSFSQYSIPEGFVLVRESQSPYTYYLIYVGPAGTINVLKGGTTIEYDVGTEHVAQYRYVV